MCMHRQIQTKILFDLIVIRNRLFLHNYFIEHYVDFIHSEKLNAKLSYKGSILVMSGMLRHSTKDEVVYCVKSRLAIVS